MLQNVAISNEKHFKMVSLSEIECAQYVISRFMATYLKLRGHTTSYNEDPCQYKCLPALGTLVFIPIMHHY